LAASHLIGDSALQELVVLKSFGQQYAAQGLKTNIEMTSVDPKLFDSPEFRNALTDLDLRGIKVTHRVSRSPVMAITLRGPENAIPAEWKGQVGPVPLGLALRKVFGEAIYSQMNVSSHE
jgi:hypothetical protein